MSNIELQLNEALKEARGRAEIKEMAAAMNAAVAGKQDYTRPINLMIKGPTGCGKTSIITQWGKDHAEEINFFTMDAALMNVSDVDGTPVIFSTDEIERLAAPDTVLFIDNYHLIKKDVEREINKLMDNREAADISVPSGVIKLDNILFVVVAFTGW